MLIYSFITDYQAFNLRYKDNTTRDKNETKVDKQSANLGKNNEPIQNRLSFLIDCKSVILHHLAILSFPMVRPAWDNWWLLVERAVSLYDGKARRKHPDDSKIKVCSDCGSTEIEIQAWVDVNTNEYHSDVDDDIWCSQCEDNVETCSKQSFLEKMQEWWKSNNTDNLEYLTGFKTSDFPSANSGQTFAEAADEWWNDKNYDEKRNIYLTNN